MIITIAIRGVTEMLKSKLNHCTTGASLVGASQTAQLRCRCESAMRGPGYGSRIGRGAASFSTHIAAPAPGPAS